MISSHHKHHTAKEAGAITLVIAIIMLIVATLLVMFAASLSAMQTRIASNRNQSNQAFDAAEAGMQYAINYLRTNATTILASPTGGHINAFSNSNTTNVSLPNGSQYSFVYTNPTANNYDLIQITATGTSADGTATRVLVQLVQKTDLLVNFGNSSVVSKSDINISGNASITNTSTNTNVVSGGAINMSGSSQTYTTTGLTSTPGNQQGDLAANNGALSGMSVDDFFATYFGTTSMSNAKAQFANYYSGSGSQNYSGTLNGMTGTSIWIDQGGGNVSLSGTTTIGSATNPVLLVIDGTLTVSGNTTIYGFVYVTGSSGFTTVTGNNTIYGALVTGGNLNITGSTDIYYQPTTLGNLMNQNGVRYFIMVPGSWKDF